MELVLTEMIALQNAKAIMEREMQFLVCVLVQTNRQLIKSVIKIVELMHQKLHLLPQPKLSWRSMVLLKILIFLKLVMSLVYQQETALLRLFQWTPMDFLVVMVLHHFYNKQQQQLQQLHKIKLKTMLPLKITLQIALILENLVKWKVEIFNLLQSWAIKFLIQYTVSKNRTISSLRLLILCTILSTWKTVSWILICSSTTVHSMDLKMKCLESRLKVWIHQVCSHSLLLSLEITYSKTHHLQQVS